MVRDAWDPDQYLRFADERRRPFDDLLSLVEPVPSGSVVDLGCGTGELTAELHRHIGAATTVGVDSSPAMLDRARDHAGAAGLRFEAGDLAVWEPPAPVDVMFANASLQWVGDHDLLLAKLTSRIAPNGQLAFQVPANHDHPAHTVAAELGAEFGVGPVRPAASVLPPERYAELIHELDFERQHVRMQVYGFELPSSADVVEWTKGTLLTRYRSRLGDAAYADFETAYRGRLAQELGERRPFFYAFKRILAWARRPG